ncbi:MAG: hypothetical protein ACOCYB_11620, partial [Alkalispirochaeta sp.]
ARRVGRPFACSIVACPFYLVYNDVDTMVHDTIFRILSAYGQIIIIAAAVIPLITLLISFTHGVYDGRRGPWRHVYALMVHITTATVAAVAAALIYHIVERGSPDWSTISTVPVVVIGGGWLFTLIFVKRAVDFSMIHSVRNPFALFLSWAFGWAAASVLAFSGIWLIPGPQYVTVLVTVVVVFFVIRLFLRVAFGVRDQD